MRLIDADALWDKVLEHTRDGDVIHRIPPDFIDNAPTVDAEPIVHAYWEKWTVDIAPHPWHCSKCGFSDHHNPHMDEYCRCPSCGARMKKGVKNAMA